MAAIKLVTPDRNFIPDVTFCLEDGNTVKNRDLPAEDQVSCTLELANVSQKSEYVGSYVTKDKNSHMEYKFLRCVKKHVTEIKGLESHGIVDGKTLINHPVVPVLNDIIQECFWKINGAHDDDLIAGSDSGDFTEGE